ncbi:MAG: hypothetical protein D6812_12960, partial [Deltaproteobacteria bacterium]
MYRKFPLILFLFLSVPAAFSASPSGAEPRQLTFLGDTGESYFSPDGRYLIYQSRKRPTHYNSQLYLLDLRTMQERRLTVHPGDDTCAYFSPDGERVIFASTFDEIRESVRFSNLTPLARWREEQNAPPGHRDYKWKFLPYEIYSVRFADLLASRGGLPPLERLTHSIGYDAEGTYAPDGKTIIFTSNRDGDLEIYRMNPDGTGQERLTAIEGYDGGAFISPDGTHFLWRGFHGEGHVCDIYIAPLDDPKASRRLTDGKGVNWCPSFHPDGRRFVFSSNRADPKNFDLYLLDIEGRCLKRLTDHPKADVLPVFSPDGTQIVFTSNRNGSNQLYIMPFVEPEGCL